MNSHCSRIRRSRIQTEVEGYLELGLPKHALAALARMGDPTGFSSHAYYLWGEALRMQDRFDEALMPLTRAATTTPNDVRIRLALGWCYKRTDQLPAAIESLERALAIEPSNPLVLYNLACYWSLAGNKSRVLRYLSKALAIDADFRLLIDDEPDFDPMRYDPDFQDLCASSGTAS